MAAAGNESRRVLFSGRVQGVGFRYTARRIAQGHVVTGFVKNLDDGRVELVVEGPPGEIEQVLEEIAQAMRGNIRDTHVEKGSPSGKYSSFDVAF